MPFAPDNKFSTSRSSGQLQNQAQTSQWPMDCSVDKTGEWPFSRAAIPQSHACPNFLFPPVSPSCSMHFLGTFYEPGPVQLTGGGGGQISCNSKSFLVGAK